MDLFAIPRDVRDIIWAENRAMLRAERVRITTHFVKEVLRELSEREFPAKRREVAIEGHIEDHAYVDDDDDDDDDDMSIVLTKTIGGSQHGCENYLRIEGNTVHLHLSVPEKNSNEYLYVNLYDKEEAYKVFILGDFEFYVRSENICYEYESENGIYYDDDYYNYDHDNF
jgi:hypothetical protein